MTGSEFIGIAARELPAGVKRRMGWIILGAFVPFILIGAKRHETTQNQRLTELEDWKVAVDSARAADGSVLTFLGCVQRQELQAKDPSGCDYDLPDHIRARLLPPGTR